MPQNDEMDAGSERQAEPAYLVLGKLRRAHGVRGEIPMEVYTHMLELLLPDQVVYIGESYQPFTIESIRWKNELLLLKFNNIDDRTVVSNLTNELLYIKTEQLPVLSEDELYYHEIIGLDVHEEDGRQLGVLVSILETGANDVYLVRDEAGNEILIPAIEDVILEIDLDRNLMIVARLEWYGEGD